MTAKAPALTGRPIQPYANGRHHRQCSQRSDDEFRKLCFRGHAGFSWLRECFVCFGLRTAVHSRCAAYGMLCCLISRMCTSKLTSNCASNVFLPYCSVTVLVQADARDGEKVSAKMTSNPSSSLCPLSSSGIKQQTVILSSSCKIWPYPSLPQLQYNR